MSYRQDGLRRCRKCGSYIPLYWEHCGRCGRPVRGKRSRGWAWAFLLVLAVGAFVFGGRISRLVQDRFANNSGNNSSQAGIGAPITDGRIQPIYPDTSDEDISHGGDPGLEDPVLSAKGTVEPAISQPDGMSGSRKETAGLTYVQKIERIYALVTEALKNAEEQVTIPVLGTGEDSGIVFGIIAEIIQDDPEIMFYEGCRYRTDGLLTLQYSRNSDFIREAVEATDKKADEILKKIIRPGMSDFEKELAIHDYIVNSCRYDIENLRKGTTPPEDHEAYGVLVNGAAVCDGYAKAMKLLLDRVDVRSLVVSGRSKGSAHAWNMVCLDGQYYHVDATWDDPVMSDGGQILTYTYFNLTDDDIQADHTWDGAAYPQCRDTAYNYYHYYGLTVTSPDDFTNRLKEAMENGMDWVSFRILNYADGSYDVPRLIQKAVNALNFKTLTYSLNELYGVVDVFLR